MTIEIPLSKTGMNAGKFVAIVDDIDADLAKLNWTVKTNHGTAYAVRFVYGEQKYLNRVVLSRMGGIPDGHVTKHINGDHLDNRRSNLETVPKWGAPLVEVPRKKSYIGVAWSGHLKAWRVRVPKTQRWHDKTFWDPHEAAREYNRLAVGCGARLNRVETRKAQRRVADRRSKGVETH